MADLACNCPHCSQEVTVDTNFAGQVVACPYCSGQFEIPNTAPSPPPQQAPQQRTAPPIGYRPGQRPPGHFPPGYGFLNRVGLGDVLMDPLESQPRFVEANGPGRAQGWGWALLVLCIASVWALGWRFQVRVVEAMGGEAKVDGNDHFMWILSAAIPLVVYLVLLLLFNAMGGRKAKFGGVVFTSGITFVPITAVALAFLLIVVMASKESNLLPGPEKVPHVLVVVFVFLWAFTVLLVKASLVSVLGFTRRAAFVLVPIVLLIVGYASEALVSLFEKSGT